MWDIFGFKKRAAKKKERQKELRRKVQSEVSARYITTPPVDNSTSDILLTALLLESMHSNSLPAFVATESSNANSDDWTGSGGEFSGGGASGSWDDSSSSSDSCDTSSSDSCDYSSSDSGSSDSGGGGDF